MKYILIITTSFFFISCSYNKLETPQPEPGIDSDAIPQITYTNFVKTLIDSNYCLQCHFTGYNANGTAAGNRDFRSFNGVRAAADAGVLQSRTIDGVQPTMPLGFPQLPQEMKDTLQLWIDQGALE